MNVKMYKNKNMCEVREHVYVHVLDPKKTIYFTVYATAMRSKLSNRGTWYCVYSISFNTGNIVRGTLHSNLRFITM